MIKEYPNIFQYQDFRKYLKDVFEYHKENTLGFSLRTLAKEMDLSTHAHFFDVMYGRKLTSKFLPKYLKWLKLDQKQAKYFNALVSYDQSSRDSDKKIAFKDMVKYSPELEILQMGAQYVEFFEKWYHPILLSLLSLHPNENNPEKLAKLFSPQLKAKQISDALLVLQKFKLVKWHETTKQWQLLNRFLKAEDTTKKMALKPYHRKMQELGIYHYDNNYEQQQFASMTLATSEETLLKVRDVVNKCRQEIVKLVQQDSKEELLMQVNMQTLQIVRKNDD